MYKRVTLLTYGDIFMEAGLDDITAEEFVSSEHPERFEYVDWSNSEPSMQYLQFYFDDWSERLRTAQEEAAIIRRWHLEVPEQLNRCIDMARKNQEYYYQKMIQL